MKSDYSHYRSIRFLMLSAPLSHASTGTDHGFYWQCYVSSGSGSISFPGAGTYPGNFAVNWSNVGDIVAGKGWNPGSARVVN